jgi:membrane-associated phospholipid phosphatase
MEELWQWSIDLIVVIQQVHGPVIDNIANAITFMGDESFYLIFLPLIFWCVDFGVGARLTIIFLLSSYLNICFKDLFQQPRPFDLNPDVGLSTEEGYGLPSYHAQSTLVVWASLSAWAQKRWLWIVGIVIIVLVGFSRIYLGLHFPTDVLAGWAIGGVLLVIYLFMQPVLERQLVKFNLCMQILISMALPLLLLLIHPTKDTTSSMAALAGIGVGLSLMHRYIPFNTHGLWWQRNMRFLIGVGVIFVLYFGLKMILPGEESVFFLVFRFCHYWLIGLWVSLGAPWLFRLLKLSTMLEP